MVKTKVHLSSSSGKPKFTSRPRDARVQEDGIVEFTCVAEGQPYPDYSWWNNDRIINSNHRITVSNGGKYHPSLVSLC